MRSTTVRTLIYGACVIALALNTGCGGGQQPPVVIAPPSAPPTTAPSAPPPIAGQGAPAPVPGAIGTPGASAPVPPTVGLPAPAGDAAQIAQIVQSSGIKRIYGSKATGTILSNVADAMRRYPPGVLKNLEICCEPSEADPTIKSSGADGYWTTNQDYSGGKMFLFAEVEPVSTITHEAGHHLTMYADTKFGCDLLNGLGYKLTAESTTEVYPADPNLARVRGTWDNTAVPATSYNRDYAKTNKYEHMAEMLMCHVSRGDVVATNQIVYPNYAEPAAAAQVLVAKVGQIQQ